MATPLIRLVVALGAIVVLTPAAGFAAVPTAEDFTHCKETAKKEMETAAASPRTDTNDKVVAAAQNAPKETPANTGKPVTKTEADPQLQGIDPEGEKDPAYIAAYKTCMRKSGF